MMDLRFQHKNNNWTISEESSLPNGIYELIPMVCHNIYVFKVTMLTFLKSSDISSSNSFLTTFSSVIMAISNILSWWAFSRSRHWDK